jgi:ribosomal protein S1
MTSIDQVKVGSLALGVVAKVLEKGILVTFIGGLNAFIPKKELR